MKSLRPVPSSPATPPAPDQAPLQELAALYRSHAVKVKGYFRRAGQSDASAEELMQETFARAVRGLPQFKADSKLSTWLWKIAERVLLEHVRKKRPDAAETLSEAFDADALSTSPAPHLNSMSDCIRRGFARFQAEHPERAMAVYLAVVEEYTREELGEFLGRSPHAATEYLSQCKAKFKPFIEHCRGD